MPIRVRTRTLSSHATLSGRNICPGAETHAHSNAAAGKPANNGGGGEPQGTAQGRMLGSAGVRVHMSSGSFPWAGAMLGGVGGSAWSTGVPGGLVPLRQHVRMAQMQRSQTQTRRWDSH